VTSAPTSADFFGPASSDTALVVIDHAGRPDPTTVLSVIAATRSWSELVVVSAGRPAGLVLPPLPDTRIIHSVVPLSVGTARNIGLAAATTSRLRFVRLGAGGEPQVLGDLSRDEVAPVGAFADATTIADARLRLFDLLTFGDDAALLTGHLDRLAEQVDGVVALDRGSMDGSAAIVAAHPVVREVLRVALDTIPSPSHVWQRRLLVNAAARHGAKWAVVADPHEYLAADFHDRAETLIDAAGADGPQAYTVRRQAPDGTATRAARLFRIRRDHDFDGPHTDDWAPGGSRGADGAFAASDLEIGWCRRD
jgi:hypothetical protein